LALRVNDAVLVLAGCAGGRRVQVVYHYGGLLTVVQQTEDATLKAASVFGTSVRTQDTLLAVDPQANVVLANRHRTVLLLHPVHTVLAHVHTSFVQEIEGAGYTAQCGHIIASRLV
jgi:hypothetical protein